MKKNIVEVVQNIERSMGSGLPGRIFRGEPACFEKISSGLYRTYGLEKGEGQFSIDAVERGMVEKARAFTDRNDPFDILCEIQHRGGKTNQIDFTRDFGVAVFFACGTAAGREREPGRVIILNASTELRDAGVSVRDITHPIHMAAAQKSVFVSSDSGFLDDRHLSHLHMWTIDADEKQEVLRYLKASRGIDSRSIFMDISGFIRHEHEFENANAWLFRARKMFLNSEFDGAIEAASKFLRLVGSRSEAYSGLYIRGQAHYRKGDRKRAFLDLRRTQRVSIVRTPPVRRTLEDLLPDRQPAYPLPDDIESELAQWSEEQERNEARARRIKERTPANNPENRMLQCIIRTTSEGSPEVPVSFNYNVLTDTGYSYGEAFSVGVDSLLTWPTVFLDSESACWWSFHGADHQHIVVPRKTVPEDFDIVLPVKPQSSAKSCTVQIRFLVYDTNKQQIKKNSSGRYELVSLM